MNSFGNVDVKSIENKAYITIETDKANELIERLNKENLLFFARYDDKKAMLQFDRTDYDKVNSITAELNPPKQESTQQLDEVSAQYGTIEPTIADKPPAEREKLIPLLDSLAEQHEKRIAIAEDKIASKTHKIEKNEAKITALTEKSQKLQNTTNLLKAFAQNTGIPGLKQLLEARIERNEHKIANINENKIPSRKAKINKHQTAIDKQNKKIRRISAKVNHLSHMSDFVKSFGITDRSERHEKFMTALIDLNNDSQTRIAGKLERCTDKLNSLNAEYMDSESAVRKNELNSQISKLNQRHSSLSAKLDKLQNANIDYTSIKNNDFGARTPELVNGLIENSEKAIDTVLTSSDISMNSLIDSVCLDNADFTAEKVEVVTIENNLKSTEMSIEQNYNMIDGVINNLPEEAQEIKAETPPEHAQKESDNDNIMPQIAETLDISVAQVMALPEELKEIAAAIYIENADSPKSELKELLSDALELTPQASDIPQHEDIIMETAEVKDVPERKKSEPTAERVPITFSRAAQQSFTAAAEKENQQHDINAPQKQQPVKEL